MVGTTAALGAAGAALGAGAASAAPTAAGKRGRLPYPAGVTDTSHCTPEVAEIFRGFYSAKSEHDAPRLMSYFSKKSAYYIDASSGSLWPSWDALNALFTPFFASGLPADALSYPLRIVGDASSAMVEFEDRPDYLHRAGRVRPDQPADRHLRLQPDLLPGLPLPGRARGRGAPVDHARHDPDRGVMTR
jgi:hypothetical protein